MKEFIILSAFIMRMLVSGCEPTFKIEGTYVSYESGSASISNDTLILRKTSRSNYVIDRKTGFSIIENGTIGQKKFKQDYWSCQLDPETFVLTESRHGKVLIPDPHTDGLLLGLRQYTRLK